ncbi:lysosome-associated membrane glycoprotein 2 isoform X1 [Cyprinus carpio]|uniref:Lysosome-associated membrane glycoprotein 2 isoform X1 n=1 Tax=Cyprinus carpio TaxID=7962 RepID=A0A9R0B967_CYPCA|nr:lysosome-associated membrane glycoprotein 2 isoform X1 [Cyprinus carpio]
MSARGCVTLLFILLSGIVHADDLVTSPLPAIQELSTSQTLSSTSSPNTSKHSSAVTTVPTTHPNTTNSTTAPPTTPHHNTTNSTTAPPTTPHHNTTNSTTAPPTTPHHNTTNSTTEVPTTAHTNSSPPVPNPTVGNYSVKSDNATVCLLAKMGLQFSFKMSENASFQTLNLDPNVTEVSGTCGSGGNDSSLVLKSEEITVHLVFTNVSQKFRLHALMLSVNLANGNVFNASNNNLSLWEASVGSSYMCKKEQSYNITDKLTIHTFELQVQPFAVQNNKFNTAEDCVADEPDNFIVPIAVGVALAVLIIIVLLAYLIGRKRSQTSGYEQFDS